MEPLSLKSEPGCFQDRKNSLISASQLILKFSLRSPSSRVCLTDRGPSSTRSISTPRVHTQQPNLFKKIKEKKVEGAVMPLKKRDENEMRGDRTGSSDCRDKLVKLVNQNKRKEQGKVMVLPLQNIPNGKENRCPTERSTPKTNSSFKFNICLDAKASLPRHPKESNDQNMQRKSSDASTLSLRTKHTASLQHQQDHQLFHRHSSEQLQDNILRALELAKKRLYQQIYSLDRKLLDDYPLEQQEAPPLPKKKQTITISLRKKDTPIDLPSSPPQ